MRLSQALITVGKLFHRDASATANEQSPALVQVRFTFSVTFWPPRLATLRNVAEYGYNLSKRGTTWKSSGQVELDLRVWVKMVNKYLRLLTNTTMLICAVRAVSTVTFTTVTSYSVYTSLRTAAIIWSAFVDICKPPKLNVFVAKLNKSICLWGVWFQIGLDTVPIDTLAI